MILEINQIKILDPTMTKDLKFERILCQKLNFGKS